MIASSPFIHKQPRRHRWAGGGVVCEAGSRRAECVPPDGPQAPGEPRKSIWGQGQGARCGPTSRGLCPPKTGLCPGPQSALSPWLCMTRWDLWLIYAHSRVTRSQTEVQRGLWHSCRGSSHGTSLAPGLAPQPPASPSSSPSHLKPSPALHPLSTGAGKRFPDGPCSAGYYCPPGQTSATPSSFRCPPGFSCPEGSPQPRACENGTFQPQEAQGSCEPCPAGFYCQASGTGELPRVSSSSLLGNGPKAMCQRQDH